MNLPHRSLTNPGPPDDAVGEGSASHGPDTPGADALAAWHVRSREAFCYWRSIHPATGLPGRQHVDPLDIPDLLPGLWLLDVQHLPFRLRYRLVGTAVVGAYDREVTGLWLDEAHPQVTQDSAYLERFRGVVAHGAPHWRRGGPRFFHRLDISLVENIVLPLASDGTRVDMLMVHSVFLLRRD